MIGRTLALRYPSWVSKSGAKAVTEKLWRSLLHTDNYLIAAFHGPAKWTKGNVYDKAPDQAARHVVLHES